MAHNWSAPFDTHRPEIEGGLSATSTCRAGRSLYCGMMLSRRRRRGGGNSHKRRDPGPAASTSWSRAYVPSLGKDVEFDYVFDTGAALEQPPRFQWILRD